MCLAGLGGLSLAWRCRLQPWLTSSVEPGPDSEGGNAPFGSCNGLTQAWHGCESSLKAAKRGERLTLTNPPAAILCHRRSPVPERPRGPKRDGRLRGGSGAVPGREEASLGTSPRPQPTRTGAPPRASSPRPARGHSGQGQPHPPSPRQPPPLRPSRAAKPPNQKLFFPPPPALTQLLPAASVMHKPHPPRALLIGSPPPFWDGIGCGRAVSPLPAGGGRRERAKGGCARRPAPLRAGRVPYRRREPPHAPRG